MQCDVAESSISSPDILYNIVYVLYTQYFHLVKYNWTIVKSAGNWTNCISEYKVIMHNDAWIIYLKF